MRIFSYWMDVRFLLKNQHVFEGNSCKASKDTDLIPAWKNELTFFQSKFEEIFFLMQVNWPRPIKALIFNYSENTVATRGEGWTFTCVTYLHNLQSKDFLCYFPSHLHH